MKVINSERLFDKLVLGSLNLLVHIEQLLLSYKRIL